MRNERGQMTIGLAVVITFFMVAGLGVLGLRFQLRREVNQQRRLDQCIHSKVWKVLRTQRRIESGNLRIKAERAVIQATMIAQPEIAVLARIALAAEVAYQETLLLEWKAEEGLWIANQGCDRKLDLFSPLPSLPWKRLPPDPIGPNELMWMGTPGKKLPFFLSNRKRTSYAEVSRNFLQWRADWRSWTKSL